MTLDEAIKHCEEKAEEKRKDYERACAYNIPSEGCLECAEEHEQLAKWLKDYKRLLEERPQGEWNYIQAGMCVCPFCGAMPHKEYKNYCAKCGAELKGGAV